MAIDFEDLAKRVDQFLFFDRANAETAEALRLQQAGEESVLAAIAHAVNRGLTTVLLVVDLWRAVQELRREAATPGARILDAWKEAGRQYERNATYYRSLLDQVAGRLGPAAYTADDGTVMTEPVYAKIPALVGAVRESGDMYRAILNAGCADDTTERE